ncbi:YidB family protein [Pararhizobium gei]|uniref:YidB family protein n=1 Tax=Pararhizobium gei TaxID=1395951 RepID=UPI0023DB510D|nr:YidB family protein [Rhizobium gei]
MSRSAMTALLSVLAVAGFQNRDKIAEIFKGLTGNGGRAADPNGDLTSTENGSASTGGLGGLFGGLGGTGGMGGLGDLLRGNSGGGNILSGGLGGLLDQFDKAGKGETAKSWVDDGPNKEIDDNGLSQALGPDVLQDIAARTGLTRDEILSRLSSDLPKAVDSLTPEGKIPVEEDDDGISNPRPGSVPSVKPTIA